MNPPQPPSGRPIENLLERVDGIRATGPDRWRALCPAHDDKSPSLSIRERDDGALLLKCWAGCRTADVLKSIDLSFDDLWPHRPKDARARPRDATLPARDALEIVYREATIAALILSDFARDKSIDEESLDRCLLARDRISAVYCEVPPYGSS